MRIIICLLFLYTCSEYAHGTPLVHEPLILYKQAGSYSPPAFVTKICPPQTEEEIIFHNHNEELNCNFSQEITNPNAETCSKGIKPVLQFENNLDSLKCYSYQYTICSIKYKTVSEPDIPSNMEMDSVPDEEAKEPDDESDDDETYAAGFLELANREILKIFSFCAYENNGVLDTVYATHFITSHLQSDVHDLDSTRSFEIENQDPARQKIFNKNDLKNEDHLIFQLLVPALDIPRNLGRMLNYSESNLQPQWASLTVIWEMITSFLWRAEGTQMRKFKHITGTTGRMEINGVQLNVGKNSNIKIPIYWWRLINVNRNENILIVMHNLPGGKHSIEVKKVCRESVCNKFGWFGISQIATNSEEVSIYCCPVDQRVLEFLQVPGNLVELGSTAALYYAVDTLKYLKEIFPNSNEDAV